MADVKVDIQVTDGGRIVTDLKREDFELSDEGKVQKLTYFGRDSEPLSLVLLLDISGSMQRWIQRISNTAREALSYLRPGDRVAILVFGKKMEVHQGFSDNLAETARQIATAASHDVGAGTYINQSVADASDYLRGSARAEGRRAILILTDNLSLSYQFPDERVIRALYGADTVLNAIVVGRGIRPADPKPGVYVNTDFTPADVFKLAAETGGEAVKADRPEVTFRDMIDHIRTRYSLSYHAPGGDTGSFRHVTVRLTGEGYAKHPWADIHARKGYYVQ